MIQPNNDTEGWMTPEEAAKHLRISRQTVYNKVSLGELPHHKRGRIVRFRRSELDAWLQGQDQRDAPDESKGRG